ncbi:hypothetical protein [Bacillus marinisedimentorum]|uniref:hypothetical protein n=1 Tax=Bacillus marinisedimentorum TaxID=1821260 RepID=UPI000872DAF5|nr:hypothetical protein [Bacillus marinisedimentorum]
MYMVKVSVLLAVLIASGFMPADQGVEVMAKQKKDREFTVKYHVQNGNLYIETYTPSIHFSENESVHQQGEGHLHVVIDGRHPVDVYKAAFIIKNLPEGKHTVRIQLAKNDHDLYGEEEVVEVEIRS